MAAARTRTLTIRVNGAPRMVTGSDVTDLLCQLQIDPEARGIAVAVNGAVVPRGSWSTHGLRDGDEVEIVGAVQGG